jgi:hypothetical protein
LPLAALAAIAASAIKDFSRISPGMILSCNVLQTEADAGNPE